ncbi:MAG TPA: type II toxin-antitoxin system HicA family toxin [Fibrella sp.]|jgi:predicted RNA binding protein YcfA (HicA-like mRNA interferase family)
MKLPRDLFGQDLVKRLSRFGYEVHHQTGSHIIVRTQEGGEHTVSVPNHKPLKIGTLSAILTDIADHLRMDKAELIERIMARRG